MNDAVIFDTNMYIYHEQGHPEAVAVWNQYIKDGAELIMPTIIRMELLALTQIEYDKVLRRNRYNYIALADTPIPIDEKVADKAAELQRKWKKATGKRLKPADSLIAATAILHKATLISHNDKDFVWLRDHMGLQYINPISK